MVHSADLFLTPIQVRLKVFMTNSITYYFIFSFTATHHKSNGTSMCITSAECSVNSIDKTLSIIYNNSTEKLREKQEDANLLSRGEVIYIWDYENNCDALFIIAISMSNFPQS